MFVKAITGGFAGVAFDPVKGTADNGRSGPNGVVASGHWLFVTDRIHEEAPDRLARRRDVTSEPRVTVLQDRQHLGEQQIVLFPKLGDGDSGALMERPEPSHQVIDLILERELGEDPDGLAVSEPLLQSGQIQGWRCRRLGGDEWGAFLSRNLRGRRGARCGYGNRGWHASRRRGRRGRGRRGRCRTRAPGRHGRGGRGRRRDDRRRRRQGRRGCDGAIPRRCASRECDGAGDEGGRDGNGLAAPAHDALPVDGRGPHPADGADSPLKEQEIPSTCMGMSPVVIERTILRRFSAPARRGWRRRGTT